MRFVPGEWYEQIRKPAFTPPDAVFAPVWTGLYVLMAIAARLIWERRTTNPTAIALTFFVLQLILNALWSYLFFGVHRIDLALLDTILLWLCILATLILFWSIKPASRPAARSLPLWSAWPP
jgi:tryptophan-rich sensory protein